MINAKQWKVVKLASLGEFKNGVNFKKGDKGHGLFLINVKDLFNDTPYIDFSTLDKVNLINQKGIDRFSVESGDIFFSRSSVKRDGVGVVSLAKTTNHNVIHCGFVIRFRATNDNIYPLFLTYLMRSEHYRQTIINMSGGSAIINISQDSLGSLEIPLPPLPIQRAIASILSNYDDLIENNNRRIKILEEMAKTVYQEWFVKYRFPNHENVKMVESELGLIPEGWQVKKLGDIASINDISISKNKHPEYINYIDISSVKTGSIEDIKRMPFADAPSRARRVVKHGDIIWSTVRPNRKSYSLIINPIQNLIASTGFAIISSKKISYSYLYLAITTDEFVNYLSNNATGSAYPAVSTTDFKNANILIPEQTIQNIFDEKISKIWLQIDVLERKNINLRKTRDLLLPKLISGEIDVENLDINTERLAS